MIKIYIFCYIHFLIIFKPYFYEYYNFIFQLKGPLEYSNGYLEENGSKSYLLNLLLPQTGFYFIHRWAAVNEAYFDMVVLTTG